MPVVPVVFEEAILPVTTPKDTDKDGIADESDKCPTVAGLSKYYGCPATDIDKDGINDEEDRCPNQPGLARYDGCLIPDSDGDGINDEMDKCPTVSGVASNSGCPVNGEIKIVEAVPDVIKKVIDKSAKNIFFETGKATLLKKSFESLGEVVKILKENDEIKLDIEGHTDNTGIPATNLKLSQNRANIVLAYLVKNGIEKGRLTAKGYGNSKPVATNKTAAGRAKNRRVVMNVI